MYRRAAFNRTLFETGGTANSDNSTSLSGPLTVENDGASARSRRAPSRQYIPVYHVELVRDRTIKVQPRRTIRNSDDVVAILKDEFLKADREKLVSIMLNAKNVVIGMEVVSVGSLTASIAHPREIFKAAIILGSAAIILSHCLCGAPHKL